MKFISDEKQLLGDKVKWTEFWYLGRPALRAAYLEHKGMKTTAERTSEMELRDKQAQALVEEIHRKHPRKIRKRRRKRNRGSYMKSYH